jgi:hypothetical protein
MGVLTVCFNLTFSSPPRSTLASEPEYSYVNDGNGYDKQHQPDYPVAQQDYGYQPEYENYEYPVDQTGIATQGIEPVSVISGYICGRFRPHLFGDRRQPQTIMTPTRWTIFLRAIHNTMSSEHPTITPPRSSCVNLCVCLSPRIATIVFLNLFP